MACRCVGDEKDTFEESCESAAQQMGVFLASIHKLRVVDLNLDARIQHERSEQLFQLKKDALERMADDAFHPIEGIDWGYQSICIDFLQLLRTIVKRLNIPLIPIDTLKLREGVFISWVSGSIQNRNTLPWHIVGDKSADVESAKQSLAKRVIDFFMTKYQFEVKDINYHLASENAEVAVAARIKYIDVKQRVLGLYEDLHGHATVIEQDAMTPRSVQSQIQQLKSPPKAPRKR